MVAFIDDLICTSDFSLFTCQPIALSFSILSLRATSKSSIQAQSIAASLSSAEMLGAVLPVAVFLLSVVSAEGGSKLSISNAADWILALIAVVSELMVTLPLILLSLKQK